MLLIIALVVLVGLAAILHPTFGLFVFRILAAAVTSTVKLVVKSLGLAGTGIAALIPVLGWIMAGLTLTLAIAIAVGNTTFLAALTILLGSVSVLIYLLADGVHSWGKKFKALWKKDPKAASSTTHHYIAKPHSRDKIENMGTLTRFFWLWSLVLYYTAFTCLFLPMFTTEITGLEITLVLLGATIVLVGGALGILAFVRFIVLTTGLATAVILLAMLFAPIDVLWTNVSSSNLDQKSIAATGRAIAKIEHLKVKYGGLKPSDQKMLEDLKNKKQRQETFAAENEEGREAVATGSDWLSRFDSFDLLIYFVGLGLVAAILLPAFLPKNNTAHPS